jgi:RNase P subunit RPR2
MEETWVCRKCDKKLVPDKTVFEYLGHTVSHELLKCPQCGRVLVPGSLAEGKMAEVETMLEDK